MLPTVRKDGSLNVVVESPRGSSVKFKYDLDDDVMTLSRPLPVGLTYPHDWGFLSSTLAADGDPLDVIILWDGSSYPGVIVPCRMIGLLNIEQTNRQSQRRERNDRLAALPIKAPRHDPISSVFDLTERARRELEQFFLHAVAFEEKELTVLGWQGPVEAEAMVQQGIRTFRERSKP